MTTQRLVDSTYVYLFSLHTQNLPITCGSKTRRKFIPPLGILYCNEMIKMCLPIVLINNIQNLFFFALCLILQPQGILIIFT